MRFENIGYAYLFWILPIVMLMLLWVAQRRRELLHKFAEKHLQPYLTESVGVAARKAKYFLVLTAIVMLVVAAMGPQWGFEWQEIRQQGVDIIFVLDTSKSMLATDVKPNRLERAKLAVLGLLPKLRGDRVGFVVFAGTSFLQVPLTSDYDAFAMGLQSLSIDTIPVGGTAIAQALNTAVKAFEPVSSSKVVVLISDGEDHEGNMDQTIKTLKDAGIVVCTVGIGTGEGELIPITDNEGNVEYLKDKDGRIVKTRLDEDVLKKLALDTDGLYVHATSTQFGLDLIYSQKIASMQKSEFESTMVKRYESRYQWPLFIGFVLLCIEMLLGERKGNGVSLYQQLFRKAGQHVNGGGSA